MTTLTVKFQHALVFTTLGLIILIVALAAFLAPVNEDSMVEPVTQVVTNPTTKSHGYGRDTTSHYGSSKTHETTKHSSSYSSTSSTKRTTTKSSRTTTRSTTTRSTSTPSTSTRTSYKTSKWTTPTSGTQNLQVAQYPTYAAVASMAPSNSSRTKRSSKNSKDQSDDRQKMMDDRHKMNGTIRMDGAGAEGMNMSGQMHGLVPGQTYAVTMHQFGDTQNGCSCLGQGINMTRFNETMKKRQEEMDQMADEMDNRLDRDPNRAVGTVGVSGPHDGMGNLETNEGRPQHMMWKRSKSSKATAESTDYKDYKNTSMGTFVANASGSGEFAFMVPLTDAACSGNTVLGRAVAVRPVLPAGYNQTVPTDGMGNLYFNHSDGHRYKRRSGKQDSDYNPGTEQKGHWRHELMNSDDSGNSRHPSQRDRMNDPDDENSITHHRMDQAKEYMGEHKDDRNEAMDETKDEMEERKKQRMDEKKKIMDENEERMEERKKDMEERKKDMEKNQKNRDKDDDEYYGSRSDRNRHRDDDEPRAQGRDGNRNRDDSETYWHSNRDDNDDNNSERRNRNRNDDDNNSEHRRHHDRSEDDMAEHGHIMDNGQMMAGSMEMGPPVACGVFGRA